MLIKFNKYSYYYTFALARRFFDCQDFFLLEEAKNVAVPPTIPENSGHSSLALDNLNLRHQLASLLQATDIPHTSF